ncbi:MAG: efflux RND transporter permease subunit [Maritimibacter sp.]|nr:efflux RND transporter permease subunit [Maritimibacter sp.]
MTHIVDIAAARARMVIAFIGLTIIAGIAAYVGLPKEGEPDIEIPALFVSVPFPGISAEDSERLLVQPMETELSDIDGLKTLSGTAAEGYAGVAMEFEFGWDRTKVTADVRDAMNRAESRFPAGADTYSVNEINFSEFPIAVVNLTGDVPERSLVRLARDLQDEIEGVDAVLEAQLTGYRDEMLEVVIDPLRLEAYNVTAAELISVVTQNNRLIAAGQVTTASGANSVKIPSSFDDVADVYALPVKVNGDAVVTLGALAEIRLTFEDRAGTARFNGDTTVSLQVVKRKGFNLIDTAAEVRRVVAAAEEKWPVALQDAVQVTVSNDSSYQVASMVSQLEGSVITAIALVMIVVLASLGMRSALLVGFAIPTSFLLTFAMFAGLGYPVSNIVMFGLILAVGMLVDGAIVVVEYADKRISEGVGPMHSYVEAAKRMFWPIVSSTATTLSAFLPMLFWPGVPGEFMEMLPKTLIFVLMASLVVALVFLPVVGGVAGRMSRALDHASDRLRPLPWPIRAALIVPAACSIFLGAMQLINPGYLFAGTPPGPAWAGSLIGGVLLVVSITFTTLFLDAAKLKRAPRKVKSGYRRKPFGRFTAAIAGNPVMPVVTILAVLGMVFASFTIYGKTNYGTEFFADVEPENLIVYVQARGNLSVAEKDALVARVEEIVLDAKGVKSAFAFAGEGGLNQMTGGAGGPRDQIGQVQIEVATYEDRPVTTEQIKLFGLIPFERRIVDQSYAGTAVVAALEKRLAELPGIRTEVLEMAGGPASSKPLHLRLSGTDWVALTEAAEIARQKFETTPGITGIEDTLPLPGIDWQLDVDVEAAGRYGTNVATVGGMVQLVTNGILLDTMRIESSDEEIEIRVRLPAEDRLLSTLDTLKLQTARGLVPLSNFVTRTPVPTLAQIDRVDGERVFDVKAGVADGLVRLTPTDGGDSVIVTAEEADARLAADGSEAWTRAAVNATERIETLTEWLDTGPLPEGVTWEWTGDFADQAESQTFLVTAFAGALFLMFLILLAQFNSFYNAVLVLLAVVLSTAGVLVGMLVMQQPFSIIMTGTGIVALAGIVVNNNIVFIDTYQDYEKYMPRIEAIIRTAEDRIRPVLLTTITTMAGLTPMMFGLSLDFINGGYSIDAPTALWWKQLATAVVFGLGIATVLTLVFTPAMLALRVWLATGAYRTVMLLQALTLGKGSEAAHDRQLRRDAKRTALGDMVWALDGDTGEDAGGAGPDATAFDQVLRDSGLIFDEPSTPPAPRHARPGDTTDDAGEPHPREGLDRDGNPLKAAE